MCNRGGGNSGGGGGSDQFVDISDQERIIVLAALQVALNSGRCGAGMAKAVRQLARELDTGTVRMVRRNT